MIIISQCIIYQNIMLYALNIYNFCQSLLNKTREKNLCEVRSIPFPWQKLNWPSKFFWSF